MVRTIGQKQTNSFVFKDHGFGVILGARCASTSFKIAMIESAGMNIAPDQKGIHKNPYVLNSEVGLKDLLNYKAQGNGVFVLVRDPVERIKSVWRHLVKDRFWLPFDHLGVSQRDSFEVFVNKIVKVAPKDTDIHLKPIWNYSSFNDFPLYTDILYYENLEGDYQKVKRASAIPLPDLKHRNAAKYNPQWNISLGTINKIKEYYKDDYEKFGY